MCCYQEETFGPLVPMALFRTEEEVIAAGNDTEFGLASYVFTADAERAQRVAAGLRFGHVGWNTGTGPTPEAPFGGMKASGIGREGGWKVCSSLSNRRLCRGAFDSVHYHAHPARDPGA